MDWRYLAGAVFAAIAASALVHVLLGVWLKRALDRRLEALANETTKQRTQHDADAGRFADVAQELVNLARNATESAIRKEELDEWHRPNRASLGADDVSEAIRGRLRRASWDAVAATSSLSAAIRKHRELIPAVLESELTAFCDRLNDQDTSGADRKQTLASALDELEASFRDSLGATVPA